VVNRCIMLFRATIPGEAPTSLIVVVQRQTRIAVHAEADRGALIELWLMKKLEPGSYFKALPPSWPAW